MYYAMIRVLIVCDTAFLQSSRSHNTSKGSFLPDARFLAIQDSGHSLRRVLPNGLPTELWFVGPRVRQ